MVGERKYFLTCENYNEIQISVPQNKVVLAHSHAHLCIISGRLKAAMAELRSHADYGQHA